MLEIDIQGGDFTYAQRIELGQIFATEMEEYERYKAVFKCLHDKVPKATPQTLDYLKRVVEGLAGWVEKENTLLNYEPTSEELKAGIKQLSEEVGTMGTVLALARSCFVEPDEVLKWKYSKVFGILLVDLKQHKYQRRFNNVLEDQYKAK